MKQIRLNSLLMKLALSAFMFLILSSCGGGSGSSIDSENLAKKYYGVAQKGPFSIGSAVKLSLLDAKGVVTGDTVQSEIFDKKGTFAYILPSEWLSNHSFYEISVEGSFLDESQTSDATQQIQLTSITNNPDKSSVNLLTHWVAQRSKGLTEQGISINNALEQAKSELYDLLGTDNISQLDFTQLSQLQSDNALLLLLSGALMDIVKQHSLDVQLVIDQIGTDFSDDGKLSLLGDSWFKRMQAAIRDNPERHTNIYSKNLQEKISADISNGSSLPLSIPLASRPAAIVPKEVFAEPGETIVLDGSASHDSGDIINYTWFRIDQQAQFDVPVSDRFAISPIITVPNVESVLLYALVVTDSEKLTDTAVIRVVVKIPPPQNQAPIADSQINTDAVNTDEDIPVDILLTGSDPDSDPISFVISTPLLLPNGILEGTAPNLIYTPTLNSTLGDSFTFLVNDSFEDSSPATVEINVTAINDAPVADAGLDQTKQGLETVTLDGAGIDVDGTIASYLWSQTSGLTVDLSDLGIPNPTFITPSVSSVSEVLTFQLIVTDNEGATSLADEVVITVTKENQPPTADAGLDQTVTESNTVTLDGSGSTDPEDGAVSVFAWTAPAGITLSSTTAAQPTFDALSVTSSTMLEFTLVVKDSKGLASIPDTVVITVNPNQPPQANAGPDQSVDEGLKVTLNGSGTDPEDGATSIFEWTAPAGVTLSSTTANKPTFDAPAVSSVPTVYTFTLVVKDSKGLASAPDAVEITVNHVNKKPTANTFDLDVNQGSPETIPQDPGKLGGTDPDGDELTLTDRTAPSNGIVSVFVFSTGKLYTYTPNSGFCGVDSFKYKVTDGVLKSDFATVTIHVNCKPTAHAGKDRTITEDESVTLAGSGTDPEDGVTTVFEWTAPAGVLSFNGATTASPTFIAPSVSTNTTFTFKLIVKDSKGLASAPDTVDVLVKPKIPRIAYIKPSNPDPSPGGEPDGIVGDFFGKSVSLSEDGATMAVGTDINRVYIFSLTASGWIQQATFKGDNTEGDDFGRVVSLSNDGNTLVVSAPRESSDATGVGGDQINNNSVSSGAVYVFTRIGSTWSQQAFIKASNTEAFDFFGVGLSISGDGKTIAVGAPSEDSSAVGIDGDQSNNDLLSAGAVYIFKLTSGVWAQEAYVKASNTGSTDSFGGSLSLNELGDSLIVGATGEDLISFTVENTGAVYHFTRTASAWSEQSTIRASNPDHRDNFGTNVVMSKDGNTFVATASREDSSATGVNGDQTDNSTNSSGAVYVFTKVSNAWIQQAYIKASNTEEHDIFGYSLALSANGNRLVVGAPGEDSSSKGVTGTDQSLNDADTSGAVYIFDRTASNWSQTSYVKSSNTDGAHNGHTIPTPDEHHAVSAGDFFGASVAVSASGETVVVGAIYEEGSEAGIDGDQTLNGFIGAGAVYANPHLQ